MVLPLVGRLLGREPRTLVGGRLPDLEVIVPLRRGAYVNPVVGSAGVGYHWKVAVVPVRVEPGVGL